MAQTIIYSKTSRDQEIQRLQERLEKSQKDLQHALQIETELKKLSPVPEPPALQEIFSNYQPLPENVEISTDRLDQDLEICRKCLKESKLLLQRGKITYNKYDGICYEIESFTDDLLLRKNGTGSDKKYPDLITLRWIFYSSQQNKIHRSVFEREKINVEDVEYLSTMIRKNKENIIRDEEKIKKLLQAKLYPEEDVIKFNSLNINPEDDNDYNSLVESYRESYEKYAIDNNLCSAYFTIVQLLEEYYTKKKYFQPHIVKYRQIYYNREDRCIFNDILSRIVYHVEMEDERRFLGILKKEMVSLQEYLIEQCNIHYMIWLNQNVEIELKCPKHENCTITNRQEKCSSGMQIKPQLNTDMDDYDDYLFFDDFTSESNSERLKDCYIFKM